MSCLHLNTPLNESETLIVIGFWKSNILNVFKLSNLELVFKDSLMISYVPSAALLVNLNNVSYLLVSMRSGHLITFERRCGQFCNRKLIVLGSASCNFSVFTTNGEMNVFAASERPVIIYARSEKLIFMNVNLRSVVFAAGITIDGLDGHLVIASSDSFSVGKVELTQKLHVKQIPIGETVSRIVHYEQGNVFAILTSIAGSGEQGAIIESGSLKIVDENTFKILDCMEFSETELGQSLLVARLSQDSEQYIVIGTAYVVESEDEPKIGRILVCSVESGKIVTVGSLKVAGSVYSLASLGEKLIAAVNSSVLLLSWDCDNKTFETVCTYRGFILALRIVVSGNLIVVADLMKSITCLVFDTVTQKFVEKARDYETNWMTSVEAVTDELFFGSETNRNLLVWNRQSGIDSNHTKRLETVGAYHLGENVNRIRKGSLIIENQTQLSLVRPEFLYCTTEGSIGVVATVKPEYQGMLTSLEKSMEQVIAPRGGFSHKE